MLLAFAPMASAHETEDPVALKVASGFAALAGSEENALALAHAIHDGAPARLSMEDEASPAVPDFLVIEPPTGPMGWHDVRMALMLARDALRRHLVYHPTLEQLQAVLLGGEITTRGGKAVSLRGVLRMRADGLNWGAIAAERYRRAS
jgi:hypothetical protein